MYSKIRTSLVACIADKWGLVCLQPRLQAWLILIETFNLLHLTGEEHSDWLILVIGPAGYVYQLYMYLVMDCFVNAVRSNRILVK